MELVSFVFDDELDPLVKIVALVSFIEDSVLLLFIVGEFVPLFDGSVLISLVSVPVSLIENDEPVSLNNNGELPSIVKVVVVSLAEETSVLLFVVAEIVGAFVSLLEGNVIVSLIEADVFEVDKLASSLVKKVELVSFVVADVLDSLVKIVALFSFIEDSESLLFIVGEFVP